MNETFLEMLQQILNGEGKPSDLIILLRNPIVGMEKEWFSICNTLDDKYYFINELILEGAFDKNSVKGTEFYKNWKKQAEKFIKDINNFNLLFIKHMYIPEELRGTFYDKLLEGIDTARDKEKAKKSLVSLRKEWFP